MSKFYVAGQYRYGQCPACRSKANTMVLGPDGTYTCMACGLADSIKDKTSLEAADNTRIYQLNKKAAELFHKNLSSKYCQKAFEYVFKKRQLSKDITESFLIGYATGTGYILKAIKQEGFTDEELVASGLWNQNEDGSLWFRFKDRVMFPITDKNGNIIGFSGRVLDDSEPKYKNTPETEVFKKRDNLFAYDKAILSLKDYLIICEGQMDVIAMHQAGFTNAVASLGTALTESQVAMIKKYTNRVVILYDTDEAGKKASKRAITLLRRAGIDVYLADTTPCKDPDEYIKEYGSESLKERITSPVTATEYLVKQTVNDTGEKDVAMVADILLKEKIEKARKAIQSFR